MRLSEVCAYASIATPARPSWRRHIRAQREGLHTASPHRCASLAMEDGRFGQLGPPPAGRMPPVVRPTVRGARASQGPAVAMTVPCLLVCLPAFGPFQWCGMLEEFFFVCRTMSLGAGRLSASAAYHDSLSLRTAVPKEGAWAVTRPQIAIESAEGAPTAAESKNQTRPFWIRVPRLATARTMKTHPLEAETSTGRQG